jgi:tetratricopeptide (TPR) repeat protein
MSMCIANDISAIEKNIIDVNQYFSQDSENLSYEKVIILSRSILESRESYSNETLGKTFVLLADVASNKGEYTNAFQFAQDGLSLMGLKSSIKLSLLLKITDGYYKKEKYQHVQRVATNVVVLADRIEDLKFRLIALSYRAVAYALQNQNDLALDDLKQVEKLLSNNPQYADHLCLLEILSTAHYYLGDYQTSLTIENKLLTLRFDLEKTASINETYLNLARAYLQLNLLDDAYNAYWEARKFSIEKKSPIQVAYAELGLAEILMKQKEYRSAYESLQSAKQIFKEKSLTKPYLTTLIFLAKTTHYLDKKALYHQYLQQAELIAKGVNLSIKQSQLYLLLSNMYQDNNDYPNALKMHKLYLEIFQSSYKKHNKATTFTNNKSLSANAKSRDLVLKLAEQSKLRSQFTTKYTQQKQIIYLLIFTIIALLLIFSFFMLRQRALRLNKAYDEVDQPIDFLASPFQTKNIYQLNYKMARKFDYPLTIGYFSIVNWQELSFHFNDKVMLEISKTLATLFNKHRGEFDAIGIINDGEYLLLCPHQNEEEIVVKITRIVAAIKGRVFANLGEHSVKIGYAYGTPMAQDIDPYIFLSRLSESTKA